MKKIYLLLVLPLLFTACQQKNQTNAAAAKTDSVNYPYTIKKPDNWTMDTSTVNTQNSLKALKAFEKNDTADMRKYFADSVSVFYDHGKFSGTLNQFLALAKTSRDSCKAIAITMTDWEPVVSKDGKEKWVTMWYKETITGLDGKIDSVAVVNDNEYKDGKIKRMDLYHRNLK